MKELYSVGVDVTKKCTLRCLHCFNYSGDERSTQNEELLDDELKDVILNLYECNPKSICLCGGEPMLRKNAVLKLADLVKEKHPDSVLNMVTNGELITKEIAGQLWDAGFTNIQVSLDGSTPETVDWIRNKSGAYKKAISALLFLNEERNKRKLNTQIAVSFCPNKKNYLQIGTTMDLCEELGVDSFRVQPLMLLGRAKENLKDYILTPEEYKILSAQINERDIWNQNNKKKMRTQWGDPIDHLLNDDIDIKGFAQITAYGDIAISPYIPISIGNIRHRRFKEYMEKDWDEVWNHRLFKFLRFSMLTPEKMDLNSVSDFFNLGIKQINFDICEAGWSESMDRLLMKLGYKM